MDITTVKESHQSLFNELINSREEKETARDEHSSERRRVTLHCPGSFVDHPFALSVPKAFSNTITGELELSEQVAAYNRRQSKQFHIRLQEDVSLQLMYVSHVNFNRNKVKHYVVSAHMLASFKSYNKWHTVFQVNGFMFWQHRVYGNVDPTV